MYTIKKTDSQKLEACGQKILSEDHKCGENVLNVMEYVTKRNEIEPENEYYCKLVKDLQEKKTQNAFIGIWQFHSDCNFGTRCEVKPFLEESVAIYKTSDGSWCYARTGYFLLEAYGIDDTQERPIYKDLMSGLPFVFEYTPGTPECCARTRTVTPD